MELSQQESYGDIKVTPGVRVMRRLFVFVFVFHPFFCSCVFFFFFFLNFCSHPVSSSNAKQSVSEKTGAAETELSPVTLRFSAWLVPHDNQKHFG